MIRRAGGASSATTAVSRMYRVARPHAMSASSAALLRACSLLLCLVAGSRQLSIKEFVVPKAVEVGKDAELRCQYELEANETDVALYVKWWWTPESGNGDEKQLLYQRIAGRAAESINRDNTTKIEIKDNDSIVLLGVNPVDSGTYECEVSNIDEIRSHKKLIVFSMGTGPEINYTLINSETEDEEDMLLLACEAEDVAPLPDMTVTFQGEAINISKTVEASNEEGLYKIYVNATVNAANVDGGEIRCELSYTTLEHPPYVDVEKYVSAGRDAPPSTEPPEDASEPEPTHDSLQNPSDDGAGLYCSWALLTLAAIVTRLQATL